MNTDAEALVTATQIAARLNRPIVQVRSVINRSEIAPVMRAGLVRLFDRGVIAQVRDALVRVDERNARNGIHLSRVNA